MTFRNSLILHFTNNMLMKHVNLVTMTTYACFIFAVFFCILLACCRRRCCWFAAAIRHYY